jgi:hypothetical protein
VPKTARKAHAVRALSARNKIEKRLIREFIVVMEGADLQVKSG